ncbi:all trans-polyprenyl-diphosphate synthase PDSS2-like [Coccinella septempunctata]|uniref:all trans-polyprenyl-diphosphate synthase PDSS2-like n=1 Tax=Coccinella septempunctata TaxID=41139 RepID=UPI001D05DF50|nr:all trans-polyprenyl-diphosphate synthase PDSS2-like [Coccinella septempunctata]
MNALSRIVSSQRYSRNLIRISSTYYSTDDRWMIAVKNAEKIVGYSTSFMNLRWLLTDEISNIASYVSKLIGTRHPMLGVARDLIQQNDTAKWGLIVLLVSKAGGITSGIEDIEQDELTGILHTQRSLAEITEMIKTGHQMHSTMLTLKETDENYKNLHFGNKLALLSGDYLYSKSFKDLALLNNNDLNEIIATSLRDLAHSDFIQPRDQYDKPLPSKPNPNNYKNQISESDMGPYDINKFLGNPREEWILRNVLGGITLLAKSCKGAMILGGHPKEFQQIGFELGRSLGLAWQANEELKPFIQNTTLPFSLTSAPVLFQLLEEPDMYELFEGSNYQYKEIRNRVLNGEGINKTVDLLQELKEESMDILDTFPRNDAQFALMQLVEALSPY